MAVTWSPSVDDVASYITSRTRDSSGNIVGTFTSDTKPTNDQVQDRIDQAVNDVWTETGNIPLVISGDEQTIRLNLAAKNMAAMRAAMLVELAYWPDQVSTNRSVYTQLKEMVFGVPGMPGGMAKLVSAAEEYASGGEIEAGDDVMPVFNFPDSCNMIGMRTRW